MSNVEMEWRSYQTIDLDDLKRLAEIAKKDLETFFEEQSDWAYYYQDRLVCIALCQGAAQHYLDHTIGINDFDVYSFFETHPDKKWYAKRLKAYDFGDPKFGQSKDKPNFVGRRVDCLSRSISVKENETPEEALQRYFREGGTDTSRFLSKKAVVLLWPNCGKVIWPE